MDEMESQELICTPNGIDLPRGCTPHESITSAAEHSARARFFFMILETFPRHRGTRTNYRQP